MTALAAPTAVHTEPGAFARIWRIVRLLTANPATTLVWPLTILTAIFAMTWAIWWVIMANVDATEAADVSEGSRFTGSITFIFVYMMVVAVQAINQTFPLALGFGSTRRAFSAGSALALVLLSLFYATIMSIGTALESATNGWGLESTFFRTFGLYTDAGWLAQWWVFFCWFVFFSFTGTIFAAVFVRWKGVGLTVSLLLLAVAVVGAIALLTFTDGWGSFWDAIVALGTLGVASVMLIPGIASAFLGHLLLRRATPRN